MKMVFLCIFFYLADSTEENDRLNTVMIDHLTNDMHVYEEVCLNVRDIRELKLIRFPSTFRESKAKLRAIDPCLVDIRLSVHDEQEQTSDDSPRLQPISRRSIDEHIGSNGSSNAPIVSSSNESPEKSTDYQTNKLNRLLNNSSQTSKPVTLLAKKVLPKKIDRSRQPKTPPVQITITSKLNPDAMPFFAQPNSTVSPPKSNPAVQHRSHQRFIPPRQMAANQKFLNQTKTVSHERIPGSSSFFSPSNDLIFDLSSLELMSQTPSAIDDQNPPTPPMRQRLSVPATKRTYLAPTNSLPYQNRHSGDFNHFQMPSTIGSHRGSRTVSGTSSASSLSVDLVSHSSNHLDLISDDGQYDFEKANEEFRRYLELEQLVIGRPASSCSASSRPDENTPTPQLSNSYKKEISFFDRISCTATTGTAVGYTEMDEDVKNVETFGDDALLINKDFGDREWRM